MITLNLFGCCGHDNCLNNSGYLTNSPQKRNHLVVMRFYNLLLCDLAMSCCALVLDYCYAKNLLNYLQSVIVAFIYTD